jgi:hypothetical protein
MLRLGCERNAATPNALYQAPSLHPPLCDIVRLLVTNCGTGTEGLEAPASVDANLLAHSSKESSSFVLLEVLIRMESRTLAKLPSRTHR